MSSCERSLGNKYTNCTLLKRPTNKFILSIFPFGKIRLLVNYWSSYPSHTLRFNKFGHNFSSKSIGFELLEILCIVLTGFLQIVHQFELLIQGVIRKLDTYNLIPCFSVLSIKEFSTLRSKLRVNQFPTFSLQIIRCKTPPHQFLPANVP